MGFMSFTYSCAARCYYTTIPVLQRSRRSRHGVYRVYRREERSEEEVWQKETFMVSIFIRDFGAHCRSVDRIVVEPFLRAYTVIPKVARSGV